MPWPLLQPLDNHAVCIVHYRCPDRVEVDARGLFVVVAEGFADDRKGHIPVPGYGSPGVAGTIRGQRYGQAELLPDFLQMPVYLLHLAFVLGTFRAVLPRNEGQEVACGLFRGVPVYDGLHLLFPSDREGLSRFPAAVGQCAVRHVRPFQLGHVHERHLTGEETEHEVVAGESCLRQAGQIHAVDS